MSEKKVCPALIDLNYEYHLSGDAAKFCRCVMNNEPCVGRIVTDPDELSSDYFSRGKCSIDLERIKKCPMYGISAETFKIVLKEKQEMELNEKLNNIN